MIPLEHFKNMLKKFLQSWTKDEEHFRKALHLFENALSSFQSIIFANCEKYFFNFNP